MWSIKALQEQNTNCAIYLVNMNLTLGFNWNYMFLVSKFWFDYILSFCLSPPKRFGFNLYIYIHLNTYIYIYLLLTTLNLCSLCGISNVTRPGASLNFKEIFCSLVLRGTIWQSLRNEEMSDDVFNLCCKPLVLYIVGLLPELC